jgi:hypothetical protein
MPFVFRRTFLPPIENRVQTFRGVERCSTSHVIRASASGELKDACLKSKVKTK